jgi:lysozyme family protein
MTFDETFDRLIAHEGGYTPGEGDPGGETAFGISKRSYPSVNIKMLTREQAKGIYFRDYWQRASADQYDSAIGFQLFDAAVNSGIENAVRFLQRAANVADDGYVGPRTIAAIRAMTVTDVLARFNAERLEFMTKLSVWDRFSRGWARRIAQNLRYQAIDA